MIQRFLLFVGPARARALFLLIGGTGLLSLILNAVRDAGPGVTVVQSLLAMTALLGSAVIIGGRMDPDQRARWLALLVPALGAVLLGLTVLPQFLGLLIGGAVGWIAAGFFIFMRSRAPIGVQRAVKYFRRNEYAEAVKELDALIKDEPQNPAHYRFRAEVLRVWGKVDRARRDYMRMTELAPQLPEAFNGLAEVELQAGNFKAALQAAERAATLAPDDWVALYNLGMIEDRLGKSDDVVTHLQRALSMGVKDMRHRGLMYFYVARAQVRMGQIEAARSTLDLLKRHRIGLEEWERIINSDQAATLKAVLGDDIVQAQRLANGEIALEALAHQVKS